MLVSQIRQVILFKYIFQPPEKSGLPLDSLAHHKSRHGVMFQTLEHIFHVLLEILWIISVSYQKQKKKRKTTLNCPDELYPVVSEQKWSAARSRDVTPSRKDLTPNVHALQQRSRQTSSTVAVTADVQKQLRQASRSQRAATPPLPHDVNTVGPPIQLIKA